MNYPASTSKAITWNDEDEDIFEDSTFLNNFENTEIKDGNVAFNIDKSLNKSDFNVR